MTQEQLAQAVGVERTMVCLVEGGKRMPSVGVLQRMCDALELDNDERAEAMRALTQEASA